MIIIGAVLLVMIISSAVVVFACMLSSQGNREREQLQLEGVSLEMEGRWSGANFGGQYTTTIPHCSFEPEDLEDIRATRPF